VFPLTSHLERFEQGAGVFLSRAPEGEDRMFDVTVAGAREHKKKWIVRFEELVDRTQAEQRAGWYLVIPMGVAEEARGEDEFFLFSLVGREVRTAEGGRLGEVADIVETEGRPLLEIGAPGERRRLLPFVREFILEVEDDVLVVRPPAGWEEL